MQVKKAPAEKPEEIRPVETATEAPDAQPADTAAPEQPVQVQETVEAGDNTAVDEAAMDATVVETNSAVETPIDETVTEEAPSAVEEVQTAAPENVPAAEEAVVETPEAQAAISDVKEQLGSSDRMRGHLMQYSIAQVKLNPWFGTGDVKYYYQITEEYGFLQSSHNFIIEALNCYGIFGLVFVVLLFTAIILDTGLFRKQLARDWQYRIAMLMAVGVYLAMGFVQPVVFDCLVCLVFVSTVSACKKHMAAEALPAE